MEKLDIPAHIANTTEFVETLERLSRGYLLARLDDAVGTCVLDGAFVHTSFDTLVECGLIDEFDNPRGFAGIHYYQLTERGRELADSGWTPLNEAEPAQRAPSRVAR
jgi:hypothetical protein